MYGYGSYGSKQFAETDTKTRAGLLRTQADNLEKHGDTIGGSTLKGVASVLSPSALKDIAQRRKKADELDPGGTYRSKPDIPKGDADFGPQKKKSFLSKLRSKINVDSSEKAYDFKVNELVDAPTPAPKPVPKARRLSGGRGSTTSKSIGPGGKRTTSDQRTGETKVSDASGTKTYDRSGFKTREKTPKIAGISVTRKFDPNEKNLDIDQTSDDPTSATTNYAGKFKSKKGNTHRVSATYKGDAERETGRDFSKQEPTKVSVKGDAVSVKADREKKTSQISTRFNKDKSSGFDLNKTGPGQGSIRAFNKGAGTDKTTKFGKGGTKLSVKNIGRALAAKPPVKENLATFINPSAAHWVNRHVHGKEHDHATKTLLKVWGKDRKKKEFGGDRLALTNKIARQYRNVTGRSLAQHVNHKVDKGHLPDHLRLGHKDED